MKEKEFNEISEWNIRLQQENSDLSNELNTLKDHIKLQNKYIELRESSSKTYSEFIQYKERIERLDRYWKNKLNIDQSISMDSILQELYEIKNKEIKK